VVVGQDIRKNILKDINAKNYKTIVFSLTCSEETLYKRHKKRGDKNEVSYYWLRLKPCPGDIVINTDNKNIKQICHEIKEKIMQI
jgi:broad-specificity NMP kinase